MLASDIVGLVDSDGLVALSRALAITRRQAAMLEVRARRALSTGSNPLMSTEASGTLVRPQTALGASEAPAGVGQEDELEATAQQRAARIKAESAGLRDHSVAQLRGRIRTLERNLENGFGEWSYDLALSRRIVELVEGVNA